MTEPVRRTLRRLARPAIFPGEAHRESLERELATRFGVARKERTVFTVLLRSGVVAGILAAVGVAASQVPATYDAEVGKRVRIETAEPAPPGAFRNAAKAIEQGGAEGKREIRVRVRVEAGPGKGTVATIDAWGDTIGMDDIPAAIRRAVPALSAATITVEPVSGTVHGDLGGLVGTRVLGDRLTDAQVEASLQEIEAEVRRNLAAEGVTGDVQVDVKAGNEDGKVRREIRVIVTKPPEPSPAP
jgi:hypothetical protein